jgi:WD40 repeat protein
LEGFAGEFFQKICSLDEYSLAVAHTLYIPYPSGSELECKIRIYNVITGSVYRKLMGYESAIMALIKLEDDNRLASGSFGSITIWKWRTGLLERNLTGATGEINDLCSMKNEILVSCSDDGTIRFWNTSSGTNLETLAIGHVIQKVILLKNGRYLASTAFDSKIRLCDVVSKLNKTTLEDDYDSLPKCLAALDHKSPLLAAASFYNRITIWNYETREKASNTFAHSHCIYSILVLSTGHLASASADGTVRIWNLAADRTRLTLNMTFIFDNTQLMSLSILSDGNLAIAVAWRTIQIRHFSNNSNYSSGKETFKDA